jgi:hypothetical protein
MLVFTVAFVSLAGFQDDDGVALMVLIVFVGYMTIRYWIFNSGKPLISHEEQSVLFVLYVINANMIRKKLISGQALARSRGSDKITPNVVVDSFANKLVRSAQPLHGSIRKYLPDSVRKQQHSSDEDVPSHRSVSVRSAGGGKSKHKRSTRITVASGDNATEDGLSDSRRSNSSVFSLTVPGPSEDDQLIAQSYDQAVVLFEHNTEQAVSPIMKLTSIPSSAHVSPRNLELNVDAHTTELSDHQSLQSDSKPFTRTSFSLLRRSFSAVDSHSSSAHHPMDFKFSATEHGSASGRFSRNNSADLGTTIDGFAAEQQHSRTSSIDASQQQVLEQVIAGLKSLPNLSLLVIPNPSTSHSALVSIEETQVVGDREDSLRIKPQPQHKPSPSLQQQSHLRASFNNRDKSSIAAESPTIHTESPRNSPQDTTTLLAHPPPSSATPPHSENVSPQTSERLSDRLGAFRLFTTRKVKLRPLVSPSDASLAQPTALLDLSILDMYRDEMEEYYSHNKEEKEEEFEEVEEEVEDVE